MNIETFQQHLFNWEQKACGNPYNAFQSEIEAKSEEDFKHMANDIGAVAILMRMAGHTCQFNKGGTSTRRACWIKSGPHTLKVVFSQKARAQAVTETSKAAYHSLDFTKQMGKVAELLFKHSLRGEDVTRKELEVFYSIPSNVVTGRVNELLKLSEKAPFEFGGKMYTLTTTPARLSVCPGASPVKNEGLMWVEVIDNLPVGAQTSLFQAI